MAPIWSGGQTPLFSGFRGALPETTDGSPRQKQDQEEPQCECAEEDGPTDQQRTLTPQGVEIRGGRLVESLAGGLVGIGIELPQDLQLLRRPDLLAPLGAGPLSHGHVYGGRRNELGRRNRAGPPRTGKGTSVRGDGGTGAVILRRGDLGEFGGQTASRGVLIAQGRHLGDGLGAVIDTSWRPLRSRTRSGGGPSRQLAHGDLAAGGLGLLLF